MCEYSSALNLYRHILNICLLVVHNKLSGTKTSCFQVKFENHCKISTNSTLRLLFMFYSEQRYELFSIPGKKILLRFLSLDLKSWFPSFIDLILALTRQECFKWERGNSGSERQILYNL
uniref:Uncharacterized protein n=1 Tax=Trichogramma kaykai TaxID=54128 RepID=A0ABD2W3Y8_9HYME